MGAVASVGRVAQVLLHHSGTQVTPATCQGCISMGGAGGPIFAPFPLCVFTTVTITRDTGMEATPEL